MAIQDCGFTKADHFYGVGIERWALETCTDPWCSRCEMMKCSKIVQKCRKHVDYYDSLLSLDWQFLTMSCVNDHTMKEAFDREKKVWGRFRTTMAKTPMHPWQLIETWVGYREVTFHEETGYNLHRHMLVAIPKRSKLGWKAIHSYWQQANKGHGHFHARPLQNNKRVSYALKYARKGQRLYWGGLHRDIAWANSGELRNRPRLIRKHGSNPPAQPSGLTLCCTGVKQGDCKKR